MLVELAIHNLAVIRETRMAFGPGLNALTGETGAGKSMVIDALSAVLGARTSAEIVRTGANGAWVEAVFDISRAAARERILAALAEAGIEQDPDEPLILSRDINVAGRSTARIANRTVTAGVLARIGELLVDIHGQSDHLSLLRPSVQLDLIDHFAGTEAMREELASALDEWNRLRTRIHDFDEEQRRAAQRIDLLRFQSEELAAANVQLGEDEALQQERARLANAERLLHAAADAQTALAGDPTAPDSAGAIDLLRAAGRLIGDIAAVDSSFEPVLTRTNDAVFALEDVAAEVRDYAEKVELDPRRLETVEERLDLLRRLKRKYGPTLAEVLAYADEGGTELAQLESAEHDIDALRAEEEERRL
ncbi:MAG TPA: AAA family ATPase, partial [Thermomicrobiales bacterium]|nr:AAA family ATPase [Thermomicrobiales bacterium]